MANFTVKFGRCGKDPEFQRVGQNQTLMAKFSIATSEPPRVKGGEWETTWHNIKCAGKTAEKVQAQLKKGCEVALIGKDQTDTWDDEQGQKKYYSYIFVKFQSDIVIGKGSEGSDGINQEAGW